MPNAAGAGYYRWSLKPQAWRSLIDNLDQLDERETLSLIGNLFAAYRADKADLDTVLQVSRLASRSKDWDIAREPMQGLRGIKNFLLPEPQQEAAKKTYQTFYRPALDRIGLNDVSRTGGESDTNAAMMRSELIWFLALDAEDAVLRAQLSELGQAYVGYRSDGQLHPDALSPNLVRVDLNVATQELGAPFFDALVKHLERSRDAVFRANVINVLAFQTDPRLIAKVRALVIEAKLGKRETSRLVFRQARRVVNRDTVWRWATENFDDILERIPQNHHGGMPWLASAFCSLEKRDEVRSFFEAKIDHLQGGPRTLASVLENIELCAAAVASRRAAAVAYFEKQ